MVAGRDGHSGMLTKLAETGPPSGPAEPNAFGVSSCNMQLRSAILYVKDLERMKRFYGEMLGTVPSNQGWTDAWATFETGGACFSLHAIPAEIAKRIEIESPPIPREEHPVKLIFEVTDVESERARLESLGIQILRRPWQRPGEACDAVDPEGNVFQICSPF
jgi:predicted enzyme related to lactoylglutathione lyase